MDQSIASNVDRVSQCPSLEPQQSACNRTFFVQRNAQQEVPAAFLHAQLDTMSQDLAFVEERLIRAMGRPQVDQSLAQTLNRLRELREMVAVIQAKHAVRSCIQPMRNGPRGLLEAVDFIRKCAQVYVVYLCC